MATPSWSDIKHFKPSEFDSPDQAGSATTGMNLAFVTKLDQLRQVCGFAFKINSGYRTPTHNSKVGGVDGSAHTQGVAADIACDGSLDRFTIISEAIKLGFTRIGIAKTFIHLDTASNLPQSVVWLYD